MESIKDWSLKHKIVFHVIVVGVLTAVVLIFIYLGTQRNIIHTISQQKAELITATIEKGIFNAMKEGNLDEVQSTLQQISLSKDIQKVRILDPQGEILRSSNEKEQGKLVDSDSQNQMNEFLSNDSISFFVFNNPKSTLRGFHIIENRNECFGCHSASEEINGILEVNIDYAETSALLKKNQIKGVIIAIVSLSMLTFIIIRLFDKLVTRPIIHLKDKMREVQEGNLSIQISSQKKDEIGSLTKNFQTMIDNLKNANHKIEELHQEQMERAEHLASLGEIAAGLAHEIKNPTAGMKGALEIINQKIEETDPTKEIFSEILLQIDKIDQIIEDLLSYAKPKEMKKKDVNPNICAENSIKMARPQVKDKDIHFDFQGVENNTIACMDEDKIQEVILNLSLNSIAAINESGNISVQLKKRTPADLEIIVKDDGQGIKEEIRPQIFHPFYTTKSRGTGLGLSICKKIINSHLGSIQVESEEGKGTTFTIHLPVLKPCDS
jgi:signal transduction histidine kinase